MHSILIIDHWTFIMNTLDVPYMQRVQLKDDATGIIL